MADEKAINNKEKDIFEKMRSLELDEYQIESLEKFVTNMENYERTFDEINGFIAVIEPDIDRNKIEQKSEDLLRSYPSTIISDLNKTEKWVLFNYLAHSYLLMAIDSITNIE